MITDLLQNDALPRAIVLGAFGGAGLTLTALYSRRGPMIYAAYAALLAATALLLSRFALLSYPSRVIASLAAFLTASSALYVTVNILAQAERRRAVAKGRLPASALEHRLPLLGHLWRIGFLVAVGGVVSAAVAFVSG